MRHFSRLLIILSLLAIAVPAAAEEPELNEPCTQTNFPLVTVDEGQTVNPDTPIGALYFSDSTSSATFRVDLAGEEVGTTKNVHVELTWTNGVFDDLSDYEMDVNGTVYNEVASSESATLTVGHCGVIDVTNIRVFTGTPADTLTLTVSIPTFQF